MSIPTKEEQFARKLRKCKHFNGMMNARCEVQVIYSTVKDESKDGFDRWPCWNPDLKTCEQAVYPTRAEIEEEDREHAVHMEFFRQARKAITEHSKGERGIRGAIECPKCKTGTLHYSIASCNGHCHASCTTPKCLSWME